MCFTQNIFYRGFTKGTKIPSLHQRIALPFELLKSVIENVLNLANTFKPTLFIVEFKTLILLLQYFVRKFVIWVE
jgi:hypothetical protein